jgi:hypothetical protein
MGKPMKAEDLGIQLPWQAAPVNRMLVGSEPAALEHARAVHPQKIALPWDYAAYATCFYAGWAGGGDPVKVADECHKEWIG